MSLLLKAFTKIQDIRTWRLYTNLQYPRIGTTKVVGFAWITQHGPVCFSLNPVPRYLRHTLKTKTTWWFQPIWKTWVKLDHFPQYRDEHKQIQYLKPPPRKHEYKHFWRSYPKSAWVARWKLLPRDSQLSTTDFPECHLGFFFPRRTNVFQVIQSDLFIP